MKRLILFLASGGGVGYLPGAKGTYGSLIGIGLYFLLRQINWLGAYIFGTTMAVAAAVWVAHRAEKILRRKDAQEIVIDEVACFPVAMLGSEIVFALVAGQQFLFTNNPAFFWGNLAVVFAIYRALDILKPALIKESQKESGGWGIVLDDLLAGVCTAAISAFLLFGWFWINSLNS